MYPAEFDYYRARSLSDAQALLAEHPGAKLLAGGHSLIPLLKLRLAAPSAVIDIGRVTELRGISLNDGQTRIGPLTTHPDLCASADLLPAAAQLARSASHLGQRPLS